ncbi:ABC transporter ATP-binding protein [Jatrophihabitans sp.]|uniref:ABC transporter ATP-binding protein n=1 Tax=Jatrophihabitans sp. TaxID=1932789 RepID=UPI0030C69606|nr:multidrug transporter ATP-binding protein [Jatrophihabitans sp.]
MLMRLLRTFLRPYRTWLAAVVVLQLISTVAALYLPTLNGDIIDRGVTRGDTGYILRLGGIMLAVGMLQIVASVAAVFFGARAAMSFGRDLRARLFHRVGEFSAREVGHFGAPSLITRGTNDVQQVQMLVVLACTLMIGAPISIVGGIIMALRQDLGLSWLLGVSLPFLVVVIGVLVTRLIPLFREMQSRIDTVNRILREQITGMRVVRAFVREPLEEERFGRANDELTLTGVRAGRLMMSMFPTVMLVLNLSSVAVLWFGANRISHDQTQIGDLTAFLSYLAQILMSVMMATFMVMMVPRAAVCAERIQEVLDTEPSVVVAAEPVREVTTRAEVELRGVSFAYPGAAAPVLAEIDLRCRPGTTTAFIGSTGSGKTTLISLIPRLYDATSGSVLVDGVDVRDLDPDLLSRLVGLVPQRAYLFSGTVASNLRYGDPEATDDELWAALEIAQATDFVKAMPEQLETAITQGGTNVSGGQRQRLAIARALVRRPEIYLFDESFSALDLGTDARLRAALRPVTRDAAVLIVASRVSTIIDADQIVVLEAGHVVGVGTHDELLANCPTYTEIVESQLSAADAA